MRYTNMDLLIDTIEKIEKIDKETIIQIIKNCEVDPYRDLLIKLYSMKK